MTRHNQLEVSNYLRKIVQDILESPTPKEWGTKKKYLVCAKKDISYFTHVHMGSKKFFYNKEVNVKINLNCFLWLSDFNFFHFIAFWLNICKNHLLGKLSKQIDGHQGQADIGKEQILVQT